MTLTSEALSVPKDVPIKDQNLFCSSAYFFLIFIWFWLLSNMCLCLRRGWTLQRFSGSSQTFTAKGFWRPVQIWNGEKTLSSYKSVYSYSIPDICDLHFEYLLWYCDIGRKEDLGLNPWGAFLCGVCMFAHVVHKGEITSVWAPNKDCFNKKTLIIPFYFISKILRLN